MPDCHRKCIARIGFFAALTVILTVFPNAAAFAITMDGEIAADAHWTKTDSPVVVAVPDLKIAPGTTLTIDAGVTVRLSGKITAYGAIVAGGTSAEPVVFEAMDPASGWDGISFARIDCADPLSLNVIQYAVLKDLRTGLGVDRQSLSLENSDVTIATSGNFALRAVNDNSALCPGPWAELHVLGNSLAFTSSYSGADGIRAVSIEGMSAHVADNVMTLSFTGEARSADAIYAGVGTGAPFVAQISGNVIDAAADGEFTDFLFGIRYADPAAVGTVAGNTVSLSAKNEIRGLVLNGNAAIGNDVTAISDSDANFSPEIDLIGIESRSDDPNAVIADNRVSLSSPDKRYAIALFCQSGLIENNRLIANLSGPGGYAIGIMQQYGSAILLNNSILLTGSEYVSLYGGFFPASSDGDTLMFSGNVMEASGASAKTQGIFVSPSYEGIIDNSYNLLYGFTTDYNGVVAGEGDIYNDPLFSDLQTLELSPDSPALAGTSPIGADPSVATAALPTEPVPPPPAETQTVFDPAPISESAPEPTPQEPAPAPSASPEPVSEPVPEPAPQPAPAPLPPETPVIVTNNGVDFTTAADRILISGTADPLSVSLYVNNAEDGVAYAPGETSWSYAGSLELGVNTFTVFSKDAAGLVSSTATIQVTRADVTPPTIVSVFPVAGARNVGISSSITVSFFEGMDASTMTSGHVRVDGMSGSVSYADKTMQFVPTSSWQYDTVYSVTLTTGLKDEAGNALASYVWSFTTESAPCMDFRNGHHYGDDRCKEKNQKEGKHKGWEKNGKNKK